MVTTDNSLAEKERFLRERDARPRDSRLGDSVYAARIHEAAVGEITVNDDLRDLTERAMTISSLPSMPLRVGRDQDMKEKLWKVALTHSLKLKMKQRLTYKVGRH